MNLELTISGQCIIAMKSTSGEDRPEHPDAVDIICPAAPMHCARLSYLPGLIRPQIEPEMVIDNRGQRIASMDLMGRVLRVSFGANPISVFSVHLEPTPGPPPFAGMKFVPTLDELGFLPFTMPASKRPAGASARITLPCGDIYADEIVNDFDTGKPVIWDFPKKPGLKRALANRVVYRSKEAGDLTISTADGIKVLEASGAGVTLQMSLSNDDCVVPIDYNDPVVALRDLEHLRVIAPPNGVFQPPTIAEDQRTGRPICNQVIFSYKP